MKKLTINSSEYSDIKYELRSVNGSRIFDNEKHLTSTFQGRDLKSGNPNERGIDSAVSRMEARQFSMELFSLLYENGQKLNTKNWASEAMETISGIDQFELIKSRCKGNANHSCMAVSRLLNELNHSIADYREQGKEQDSDPFYEGIPFEAHGDTPEILQGTCEGFFEEMIGELDEAGEAMAMVFGDEIADPENNGKLQRELLMRIQRNRHLKELLKKAGSLLSAMNHKLVRDQKAQEVMIGIEQGRDLRKLTNSSISLLCHPVTRRLFHYKFSRNELDIKKYEGEIPKERGPIMLLIDESKSMEGKRNLIARSIAIATIHVAFKEKRDLTLIGFNGGITSIHSIEKSESYRGAKRIAKNELVMEIATRSVRGGTNFNKPIKRALDLNPLASKADLIIITDGEADVSPETLEALAGFKKDGLKFFSILLGTDPGDLESISDEIVDIEKLASDTDQKMTIGSILNSVKG